MSVALFSSAALWLLLAKETKLALSSSSGRGVVVFLRNRNSDVPLHYVAQGHSWQTVCFLAFNWLFLTYGFILIVLSWFLKFGTKLALQPCMRGIEILLTLII